MGGNMGTPPAPAQPPQVNFTTTAESRGGFNNFLKSIPSTTAMTPLPPMGSPQMMPPPNPMGNIDIFNEPMRMQLGGVAGNPLSGYGDYLSQQIDSTQVDPFIQEVEQMANDRFNLSGGSGGLQQDNNTLPQMMPFNPPQQQDMMARPVPFQMQGLGQPMRDKDGILRPSIFQEPVAREPMGLRGGPDMFNLDRQIFNDGFMPGNTYLTGSGQFQSASPLTGSLPRAYFNGGEVDDFGDFSSVGYDAPSVDNDNDDGFSFDDDVSDYSTDDSGVYTGGDDNNQDVPLPEPRPAILQEAIGRAENQVFGDTEGDALGFFNKSGGLTNAGQKEFDSAIMANLDVLQDDRPADTGIQLANVFDNQSILGDSTKNVNPADIVQASFRPNSLNSTFGGNVLDGLDLNTAFGQNRTTKPSDYEENVGVTGTRQDRLGQRQGINYDLDYNTKGTTPKEQAELRELRDIDDAEFAPNTTDIFSPSASDFANFQSTRDQLPNFGAAPTSPGRLQAQFGNTLGAGVLTPEELAQSGRIGTREAEDFLNAMNMPGTAIPLSQFKKDRITNVNPINTINRINRNNRTIDEIKADMGSRVPDTALETMEGQVGPTDTVFDIDTRDTRNFVGDDFAPALDIVDARQRASAERDANVRDMDNIDRASAGRASDFPTLSTLTRPEDYEENVGRAFDANRMADIEKLYNRNVGQTKAGKGTDPTFFEGLGVPGIATTIGDFVERGSRERMANEIAMGRPMGLGETLFGYDAPSIYTDDKGVGLVRNSEGDLVPNFRGTPAQTMEEYNERTGRSIPESQLVRNDSGRVIGIYNEKGRLVSGYDPDAPVDTGDNGDSNPLILRRIAKEKEEEKEKEDKTPNVFGGGTTATPTERGSVVVDSPFTTSVGDYSPTGFDSGDLNALIAQLLKTSNPKKAAQGGVIGYANGGGVDQALDRFLASA